MHAKKTEINAPPITSSAGLPAPRSIGSDAVGSAVLMVGKYGRRVERAGAAGVSGYLTRGICKDSGCTQQHEPSEQATAARVGRPVNVGFVGETTSILEAGTYFTTSNGEWLECGWTWLEPDSRKGELCARVSGASDHSVAPPS